jgi:hypothetical protein
MTEIAAESPIVEFVDVRNSIGDHMADFAVYGAGSTEITIVPFAGVDDPRVALAIEGDWSYVRDGLTAGVAMLALALRSSANSQREPKRRACWLTVTRRFGG